MLVFREKIAYVIYQMNDPWEKIYIGVHATCNDSVKIRNNTAQKMKFSIRIYSVNVTKSTENCAVQVLRHTTLIFLLCET